MGVKGAKHPIGEEGGGPGAKPPGTKRFLSISQDKNELSKGAINHLILH